MIRGIHHVALSTPNLDRLVSFYVENFGFEVVYRNQWEKEPVIDQIVGLDGSVARVAMLRAGNAHIEVFEYSSPEPVKGDSNRPVCDHGYTHFCIDVEDIEAEYERLLAAGMRFHCSPPMIDEHGEGHLRATYGRDPDGNVIELIEVLDRNSPIRLDGESVKAPTAN
tara:strand:- start:120 stop:620 length:501 start_codon:yes stop_codon:yes gene_type:complete